MTLIEINNGEPIPLMWFLFILLFFRIFALENIAKILTTKPRLGFAEQLHSLLLSVNENPHNS